MSRRIVADFDGLVKFVEDYHLSIDEQQKDYYKSMHKKLYAFLIFIAELRHQGFNEDSLLFLEETSSDLMTSLFCIIQGLYKTAKIELRCSIENFLKALVLIKTPLVVEEKNVYKVFDLAKTDIHFDGKLQKISFTTLQEDYKVLCRTVHGDVTTFVPISALSLLPRYTEEQIQECVKLYTGITEKFLEVLFINYRANVDKMHPENKKDLFDCLSRTTKKLVNNELFSD